MCVCWFICVCCCVFVCVCWFICVCYCVFVCVLCVCVNLCVFLFVCVRVSVHYGFYTLRFFPWQQCSFQNGSIESELLPSKSSAESRPPNGWAPRARAPSQLAHFPRAKSWTTTHQSTVSSTTPNHWPTVSRVISTNQTLTLMRTNANHLLKQNL